MAFKLSIGYETISPERRDGFLEALLTPIENMRPKPGEGAIEFSANGRTARLEPRQ